ncbi:MAG: CDP-diacylglycerol--serine O-phosphatidyltransferase [Candidatus Amulumruptor caecigallinarius]|nr:MAG: CDP-diacylglycerol--serine O-phosphatidyltransferase [Candidatus Amulumruptor caecigallinarius]
MSIRRFIPNTITCLNLICGSVACILSFQSLDYLAYGLQGYQWAFIFIGLAAIFDFMDGAMARLLHAYSEIGKELDSLSDLISFGLAPALLVFNFMTAHTSASWTSYLSLWIVVMGALRLAKFNCDDRQTTSFIGLPIPANALFWIGAVAWLDTHAFPGEIIMAFLILAFPLLMVSNLPLFSLKFSNFHWRGNAVRYLLILSCVALLITCGVPGLSWTVVVYILLSVITSKRTSK